MKLALTLVLALVMGLVSVAGAKGDDKIEYLARLSGAATGKAKFKVRTNREPEAEFEVEAQRLKANAVYDVVAGPIVFEVTTSGFGTIHVEKKFRGRNNIPAVGAGTMVSVMDEAGNVVLQGTLR